ncbi:MAG: alcohol dehydrogenase catalytic domain-containing protein, partial [Anaerolineae bacterium]|nr:alcohol dehydrogenase catalytic domain-containing protein [Anaerolineae bacterium]
MVDSMIALVYEAPYRMALQEVPIPKLQPNEVLIRVAYSGICGSELSGYEGKNSLRKPPLIMGHEFSGTIVQIGEQAAQHRPELAMNLPVTANPMITCGVCSYCLSGRQPLCVKRKLLSASLPGSNAQYVAVPAEAIYVMPEGMSMTVAALTEPVACAVHSAEIVRPRPGEVGLVVGAGPIGLLMIQALQDYGLKTIYCADLNPGRLAMAESLSAVPVKATDLVGKADVVVDAVGAAVTRQACIAAARPGGRVVFVGLHDAESNLPINDFIRREIVCYGSFAYT